MPDSPEASRRQSILEAARTLAAEAGAELTMDRIASRAGVTKATLYRYFPGKAAILDALREFAGEPAPEVDADTRRRILEAALRCAARWGFRGATMSRIGKEAGLSPAAIYWYFPSKEQLIAAVLETYTPLPQLRQLRQLPIGSEEEQLRAIMGRVLALLDERLDVIKTILSEGFSRPEMFESFYREFSSKLIAELSAYLDQRVAAGVFRPGPSIARAIAFVSPLLLYAFVRRNLGDSLPLDRDAAIGELAALYLAGLRAMPDANPNPTTDHPADHTAPSEAKR